MPHQLPPYVTDGPQLYPAPDGSLLILWSTYEKNVLGADGTLTGGYVQTYAVSKSGALQGPCPLLLDRAREAVDEEPL